MQLAKLTKEGEVHALLQALQLQLRTGELHFKELQARVGGIFNSQVRGCVQGLWTALGQAAKPNCVVAFGFGGHCVWTLGPLQAM